MATHEIKRNDTRPYWPVTLTYEDGTIPDLSGATIRFLALDSSGTLAIDASAFVTNGPGGECEWRPTADETAAADIYRAEWEVTFIDGTIQTFPTRGYDRLKIIGDLG